MSDLSSIFKSSENDESWMSISDMMTGLMMVFLFIAIIYIKEVRTAFGELDGVRAMLCSQLETEFKNEKEKWGMEICQGGLLIKFSNDKSFEVGKKELKPEFKTLLSEFYPRFKVILWNQRENVSELRIEGHASSEGQVGDSSKLNAYLYNADLSQGRSFNVMNYLLNLPEVINNNEYLEWSYNNLTAHGMSSSELIFDVDNNEDRESSRRVEFRIRTKADKNLYDLVKSFDGSYGN
jgi:outer membrane protein OmpA-like peptidoglycan-associated protein